MLLGANTPALWVTSWPFAEWVKHAWAGAWTCSLFRNEGECLSSVLITAAVAVTRSIWTPPELGMITFVKADAVRHKRDPGRCYRKAGWTRLKETTQGGLIVFQLLPCDMPAPETPHTDQLALFTTPAAP